MIKYILSSLVVFFLIGCSDRDFILSKANNNYREYKNDFNDSLLIHFPEKIEYVSNGIVSTTNIVKNDVGLMLVENDIREKEFDSILKFVKLNSIAKYHNSDECNLIVNRFETSQTYENYQPVELTDTLQVNKDCFKGLYPIPNFNRFSYSNAEFDLGEADIYVLDAKRGHYFKESLKPNTQMPPLWKNGFTRGFTLEKETRTVIYWLIIW